jgi:hypothetical protein
VRGRGWRREKSGTCCFELRKVFDDMGDGLRVGSEVGIAGGQWTRLVAVWESTKARPVIGRVNVEEVIWKTSEAP